MLITQQPAYVLHLRAYRETSVLLECLTRDHGRLGVVARGVRGPRARVSRAQLEPFQLLGLDLQLRGELATLRAAEALAPPRRLAGDALLSGLYINELVVRLSARQDPHDDLYLAYARTVQRIGDGEPLAWSLRRFERDLLAALGYGLQLHDDADSGEPLRDDRRYGYVAEHGPSEAAAGRVADGVAGSALRALAADRMPEAAEMAPLRRMLRDVIRHHLGGGELAAWRVLAGAPGRR